MSVYSPNYKGSAEAQMHDLSRLQRSQLHGLRLMNRDDVHTVDFEVPDDVAGWSQPRWHEWMKARIKEWKAEHEQQGWAYPDRIQVSMLTTAFEKQTLRIEGTKS